MKSWKTLICVAGVSLTFSASAVPLTLILQNGASTTTVVDNGVGDLDPTLNSILFSGTVGNWTINHSSGVSSGSGLDLTSFNATAAAGGGNLTITLEMTMQVFTGFHNSVGGTLSGGSAMFKTLFNGGTITSQSFVPVAFSGSANGPGGGVGLVAIQATLTPSGNAQTQDSFNDQLCVPDGGLTVSLLGFAMLSLGYLRRRIAA
jgi:hypothetical protein